MTFVQSPPVLVAGQRLRFEDGSVWLVERVSGCSATLRCVGGVRVGRRHVEFADGRTADFEQYRGARLGQRTQVSARSILPREPEP